MRTTGTLAHKTEKMLLLRLNRSLIPGFARVEQELEASKAKHQLLPRMPGRVQSVVNLS